MNNTLPIGTILKEPNGRAYRVEQVLGQGGFGITYKVSSSVMVGNVPTIAYFAVKEHFLKGGNACLFALPGATHPACTRADSRPCDELMLPPQGA